MFGLRRNRPNPAEVARMHHDNLRANLERRMEAARSKGDSELVRQLEVEYDYLTK